uniref:Uncharacterized protein n=1 Tax=virus sp. ctrcb4 TaxID=2825824 RepID=A0A8S5RPJ4_9VIRU|nr:MAG TPA: hypothetical protein [virus sp. ctrcb4]DAR12734.1 MAG TPA: hypothetical protein [Crassvirales sp.]
MISLKIQSLLNFMVKNYQLFAQLKLIMYLCV